MSRAWLATLAAVVFAPLCALAGVALADPIDVGSIVISPPSSDPLAVLLDEPLVQLGTAAALIGVVVARARKAVPWLRDPAHGSYRVWGLALALGVVAGLVGIAPPIPSRFPLAGQIAAGVGAGSLAAFVRSGARKRAEAKAALPGAA